MTSPKYLIVQCVYLLRLFRKIHIFFLIIFWFYSGLSESLKIKSIFVAQTIRLGQATWLNCSYDLEDDHLYSIKWFKSTSSDPESNKAEFYRYLANENPPINVYETPGIHVDTNLSNRGDVYLHKTDLNSEGRFWCEVLADQPSFQTVTKDAVMNVHYLPETGPTIHPSNVNVDKDDTINITCTTSPSKPQARLTWYINGQKASSRYSHNEDHLLDRPESGLKASRERLIIAIRHFPPPSGGFRLRCESSIVQTFTEASQLILIPDPGRPHDKYISVREGDIPVISNAKPSYSLGELINITCTSPQSSPAAELTWYVNEKLDSTGKRWDFGSYKFSDGNEIVRSRFQLVLSKDKFVNHTLLKHKVLAMKRRTPLDEDRRQLRIKCTSTQSKTIYVGDATTVIGSNLHSSQLFVADSGGLLSVTNGQFNGGASSLPFLSSNVLIPFFIVCGALTILTALKTTFSDT